MHWGRGCSEEGVQWRRGAPGRECTGEGSAPGRASPVRKGVQEQGVQQEERPSVTSPRQPQQNRSGRQFAQSNIWLRGAGPALLEPPRWARARGDGGGCSAIDGGTCGELGRPQRAGPGLGRGWGRAAAPTILHQHPRALGAHVEPAQGAAPVPRAQGLSRAPSMAADRRCHPAQAAEPSVTGRGWLRLSHAVTATATGGHGLVPEGVWLGRGMGRSGTGGAEATLRQLPRMGTAQLPWAQLRGQAPEPFPAVGANAWARSPRRGLSPQLSSGLRAPHTRLPRPRQRRGQPCTSPRPWNRSLPRPR